MLRRIFQGIALVVAVCLTVLAVPGAANAAAPKRKNSNTETIYLVHGIKDPSKVGNAGYYNCGDLWSNAKWTLRHEGWKGNFRTFGYYGRDSNCDKKVNGTYNSRIQWVGLQLAWDIYNNYSRHGKSVDVLAHSMGGLVIRAAITGVQKKAKTQWGKFPPYLYVEDAVTLSTPHSGTNWATACLIADGYEQCSDMRPKSGFLKWLNQNPQSNMGTDWTLIGSSDDDTVTSGSATGMTAKHKVIYFGHQGLEHMSMIFKWNGSFKLKANNGRGWKTSTGAPPPVGWAESALYFQSLL
ncbi:MAG: hypothetical protein JWN52_5361 [Actinomycetia bacterium]|nr:hypothetical protein [Actinomycetes bacterium]